MNKTPFRMTAVVGYAPAIILVAIALLSLALQNSLATLSGSYSPSQ